MKKLVLFMHTSLDGFVAGSDGAMDWITVDEEMFDYAGKRTDQADTALYGRVTYEMMESYWPLAADQPGATKHDIHHSKWYNKVAKVVVSRTMKEANLPNIKIISDDIANEVIKLKQGPGGDILIFGSPSTTHWLMAENLIDEYWLFINPVILGQGIPLFKRIKSKIQLRLIETIQFVSGVVCVHYNKVSGEA